MLSTTILTPKQEEIAIPNAALVFAATINYSRHANGASAIVSDTVINRLRHSMAASTRSANTGRQRYLRPSARSCAVQRSFM